VFNKEANTILEGFGMTEDRLKEIIVPMQGATIMEGIQTALTMEGLSETERFMVIFHLGSDFGQHVLRLQQSASVAAQVQKEAMDAVQQGGTVH
jgi:hypothetical protein